MYTVSAVFIRERIFSAARRIFTLPVRSRPGEAAPNAVKPFAVLTSAWSPPLSSAFSSISSAKRSPSESDCAVAPTPIESVTTALSRTIISCALLMTDIFSAIISRRYCSSSTIRNLSTEILRSTAFFSEK